MDIAQNMHILRETLKRVFMTTKAKHNRFCVFSQESIVKDLLYCLANTMFKYEKRIQRLQFCFELFAELTWRTKYECLDTFYKFNMMELDDTFELVDEFKVDQILTYKRNFTGVFKTAKSSADYVEPPSLPFSNHAKKILNNDGSVYDIFTEVAVIAFGRFLEQDSFGLDAKLKADAKLIFKGGASIGKFIFSKIQLTDAQQAFVDQNFILGGDNDTTIKFTYLPEEHANEVDAASERLLQDFMTIVKGVIEEFSIETLISKNLSDVEQSVMDFNNHAFSFNVSKGSDFDIVEIDDTHSKLEFAGNSNTLYSTFSKLEFDNGFGTVKFFLGRIKACFTATTNNNLLEVAEDDGFEVIERGDEVSCFGECLDVTVIGAESYMPFEVTYTYI